MYGYYYQDLDNSLWKKGLHLNRLFMNTKLPCPYCSSTQGYIYVQSHYQCLTCKRVVDDCCGGEIIECTLPLENKQLSSMKKWYNFIER